MTEWYVPESRNLLWYERGGEAVVFNSRSGRSHYLNALLNEILRYIEAAPRNASDVHAHLVEMMDGEEQPPHFAAQIDEIIASLELQGLIDPWHR